MTTLCVAIGVLSLTSLCLSAPLIYQETENEDVDLLGTWYAIALTSDACWFKAYTSALHLPSMKTEVFSTDAANIYNYTTKTSIFGMCSIEIELSQYKNGTLADVSKKNQSDVSTLWKLTGCPDCKILEEVGATKSVLLLSRRQEILSDQLQTFRKGAENHGWSNIKIMSSDHVYKNCISVDEETLELDHSALGIADWRMEKVMNTFIECVVEKDPTASMEDFDFDKHWDMSMEGKY